jgi:SAM-dependent methyltransferase
MSPASAHDRFLQLLQQSAREGTLVKLTLGRPGAGAEDLKNLFVRPVELKKGPQLCFVWRHQTRDITKNLSVEEGLEELARQLGQTFLDAHLFTQTQTAELRCHGEGKDHLVVKVASSTAPRAQAAHNREKEHLLDATAPWLQLLGITNERGAPRAEMSAKYRQIQKFAELLAHLLTDAGLLGAEPPATPLQVTDMGCGKGYLTFAVAGLLAGRAQVTGVELRPELVERCNAVAARCGMGHLKFLPGTIQAADLGKPDIVIALHACDTATDDALARGIAAEARVLLVSPCCQKELRPQLQAPAVLGGALRHGIFQERQSEFVTDALRAELLEWAGYRTRVFEFISTEHTAKNLMIAAVRTRPPGDEAAAARIRALAAFYGIRQHALARHLGFELNPPLPAP